jgi:hypothetical protein
MIPEKRRYYAGLATQKGEDGAKYRFSANQIYELVKGPRADVLDQVRAVRAGPPAPYVREHQARLEQIQAAEARDVEPSTP